VKHSVVAGKKHTLGQCVAICGTQTSLSGRDILLRASRCTAPRPARTVVHGHELRAPSGSQNEVQGPNLAGALGSFARAFATVSGAKVWN
jgi:hypothetical protein